MARYLLDRGHQVAIFDLNQPGSELADCEYYQGNITESTWLESVQRMWQSDTVFHLASVVGVATVRKQRLDTINTIFLGTQNVLQLARDFKLSLINFSSSEVYGNIAPPMSESSNLLLGSPEQPRYAYATAKALAEHLALAYHQNFKVKVATVRPFNVVGFGQTTPGMVIPTFVRQALQNQPLTVRGGDQIRCFLAVEDAVEAITRLADNSAAWGQIFNLGNPNNQISMLDLALKIKIATDSSSQIDTVKSDTDDIKVRVPDISKIAELLNWQPQIDLDEIIQSAIEGKGLANLPTLQA